MRNLFLFFLLAFPTTGNTQHLYYVDQNVAGGTGTGQDWANAFPDLQTALSAAIAGDTIWVAAGTYKPTATAARGVSFVLVDGVHLYGGFIGTESNLEERNPGVHKTILSGDIGIPGAQTDNSYHVLRGKGLGANTLLDGFYIMDGYSYNDPAPAMLDHWGAGLLLQGAPGITDSRPVIQNCHFENNLGDDGGAIHITWTDPGNPGQGQNPVNPILRHCTFVRNQAARYGGAIYKNSTSVADTFRIEDCQFLDNKAFGWEGGGIYFNSTANSNTVLRRCLFERDSSFGGAGGAVSYPATLPDMNTSSLLLDSCVFRKNMALEGAAFYFDDFSASAQAVAFNCRMQNCRFEDNLTRNSNGSAYYILVHNKAKVAVEVEDCFFEGNLASDYTTLLDVLEDCETTLSINRCVFRNNHDRKSPLKICMAIGHGGGARNKIKTVVTNCLFYNNGGGIGVTSSPKNFSTTEVANCTFFDNNEYIFIKTWDTLFNQPNGYFNNVYIDNCILWEINSNLIKTFYTNEPQNINMYGFHVNHTLLSLTDSTSVPGSAAAFEKGLIWGQFPGFQDSAAGDFRLRPCSPAVGKGNNQIVLDKGLLDDLDGQPRIRYGIVDLGAYEQQDSCFMIATAAPISFSPLPIWPNPSLDGVLRFQLPFGDYAPSIIRIFNTQGQEVFYAEYAMLRETTLYPGDLPSGFYTISVHTAHGGFVGKWLRL